MRRTPGQLRIIGGQWRRRLLPFDAEAGIRPTPDRVRETLFNWLAPWISGARCLDLYSGSGALGLEALSRGAAQVSFVDLQRSALQQIQANLQLLKAEPGSYSCHQQAAQQFLAQNLVQSGTRYDIIFADPPYASAELGQLLPGLAAQLSPVHRVYVEWGGGALPSPGWQWHKQARAGQVSYGLISRQAPEPATAGESSDGADRSL